MDRGKSEDERNLPKFGQLLNALDSSLRCTCNLDNDSRGHAGVHPASERSGERCATFSRSSSLDSMQWYKTDEDDTKLKKPCRHSGPMELSPMTSSPVRQKPLLFVTYAGDNYRHIKEVLRFCSSLLELADVKCDMFDEVFLHATKNGMPCAMSEMMLNTNDWIERHFQRARYVIVCISPLYSRYTAVSDVEERPCPTENQLHTKYIYNRIHSELMANLCLNKRFIPVLFSNSGARKSDTPPALKSTLLFEHPDHQNLLKSFLCQQIKRKTNTRDN